MFHRFFVVLAYQSASFLFGDIVPALLLPTAIVIFLDLIHLELVILSFIACSAGYILHLAVANTTRIGKYSYFCFIEYTVFISIIYIILLDDEPIIHVVVSLLLILFSEAEYFIHTTNSSLRFHNDTTVYIFYKEAFPLIVFPYILPALFTHDHTILFSLLISLTVSIFHYLKMISFFIPFTDKNILPVSI